jgi:hypothetical protein
LSDYVKLSGSQEWNRSTYCLWGPWFLRKGILPLELSRAYAIIYIYIESRIIALTYNLWRCCNFPSEEGITPVSRLLDRSLLWQYYQTSISIIMTTVGVKLNKHSTRHSSIWTSHAMRWSDGTYSIFKFSKSPIEEEICPSKFLPAKFLT